VESEIRHTPVMLAEVLDALRPSRGGLYFDGTLGDGGHSEAILEAGAEARVIGVDQDPRALEVAGKRLARFGGRVKLVHANFADAAERLDEPLAGALLDLGLSSRHLDETERGFSFRPGTPLDMRMGGTSAAVPMAADLLNELPESELADLFYRYGEERRSRRLAAAVVARRRAHPFQVSDDLLEVIRSALGPKAEADARARLFQALRIAVNDEMGVLERVLPALRDHLAPGGVLVVLSYHSLEDRQVKDAFREWSRACICPPALPVCRCRGRALGELVTRRSVVPTPEEVAENPRARSARMRAWRKAA
jgi:16S rRNA (cytosine1402-N4)-methyltransferase